jgi:hypothetical protein
MAPDWNETSTTNNAGPTNTTSSIYEEFYEYIEAARWVNQHHLFRSFSFEDFKKHPENKRYLEYF